MDTSRNPSPTVLFLFFCAALFLSFYGIFYPGIIVIDSADQLSQAISGDIHDWHSPLMTWIWSLVCRVYVGPPGMLLISQFCFFSALGIILVESLATWQKRTTVLLLVVFFPINFSLFGNVSNTSFFCAALLLAIAFAGLASGHRFSTTRRLLFGSISIVLIFFAAGFRAEGAFATLPIGIWLLLPFIRRWISPMMPGIKFQRATTIILAVVIMAGILFLNKKCALWICRGVQIHPEQVTPIYDLTALSVKTQAMLLPEFVLNPGTDLNKLGAHYHPYFSKTLFWYDDPPLHFTSNEDQVRLLISDWRHAVSQHPLLYLQHRVNVYLCYLRWTDCVYARPAFSVENSVYVFFPSFKTAHTHFKPDFIVLLEYGIFYLLSNAFLMKPYFFLILSAGNIIYIVRRKDALSLRSQLSLVLSSSALAHTAILFLCVPESDYRYSQWLILSSSLAVLLTVMGRSEDRHPQPLRT